MKRILTTSFAVAILGLFATASAQTGRNEAPRVQISFDRFYDYSQLTAELEKLVRAWPELLSIQSIGKSVGGRDMWLVTIQNKKTGDEASKSAMYIDANVHGNEVQGGEVCLYTIWYLMENYGKIEKVTQLVDERVFYVLPMVNPDGRDFWFHGPNNSSSSRTGIAPTDEDGDGLFDEDPYDDLDGDGNIVQMRKYVGKGGNWKKDPADAEKMIPVGPGEDGDYVLLGTEGIDNDGDGRTNEDGPGGYDMNRNDPTDWQPNYVQFGSGPYPFFWPEVRSIGAFILAHPNIAAVQSYHNAGGMILRGPGASSLPEYAAEDLQVYDELGKNGEYMLPYYRYMIIHKDLYTVHGGFVNWTAEGLGIISFTNELWNDGQYNQKPEPAPTDESGSSARGVRGGRSGDDDRKKWNDLLELGSYYVPWKKVKHPEYGEVEIGGWTKWSSRVPPAFMLPELCHRNMAFTLMHADAMPKVSIKEVETENVGPGLWRVRATLVNESLIPSRTAMAAQKKLGLPDFLSIGGAKALTASFVRVNGIRTTLTPIDGEPGRVRLERGVPSKGKTVVEWLVDGPGPYSIEYRSEKAGKAKR